MNVIDGVNKVLRDLSEKNDFNEESNLQSDLLLDSLAMVTLLIEIEDEFGIRLNESDMNPFDLNTVGDVVKLVSGYFSDKNEQEC